MLWKAGFLPIRIRGQSVQIRLNQSLQYTRTDIITLFKVWREVVMPTKNNSCQ